MTIVFLSPHFGTHGGVRIIIEHLARAALAEGHHVSAVVDGGAEGAPIEAVEVPLYPFPSRVSELRRVWRFARRFPVSLLRTARAVRAAAPDVVSIHCTRQFAPCVALLRHLSRVPHVLSLQEGALPPGMPENRRLARLLVRSVDAVAACSTEAARYTAALEPSARVVVIPNGFSPQEFEASTVQSHPRRFILGVGRLEHQKGFDLLIRALPRLGHDDVDLLLAGDGSRRRALGELASAEGVGSRVYFLGTTDRATTVSLLRGSSVVACPSRFEGLPLVCVEALAARRPVVAAAVNGIPEVIRPHETGILVPPEDPQALAEGLREALSKPAMMETFATRGEALVRRTYSWDVVAPAYLRLCAQVSSQSK